MFPKIFIFTSIFIIGCVMPLVTFGQTNYNYETELCCTGEVHPRNATNMCCGNVTYDPDYFVCCSDDLYPLSVKGRGGDHQCCFPPASGGTSLADSKPFNFRTHKCCDGKIYKMDNNIPTARYYCCKDQLYDFDTQFCCGDKLQEHGPGEKCCGNRTYDETRQVCCWNVVADGSLQSKVLDFDGSSKTCCAFQVYDPQRNACCDGIIKPLPAADSINLGNHTLHCCDGEPFYTPAQQCCVTFDRKNRILEKSSYEVLDGSNKTACCGTCCNSHLSHFKPPGHEYNLTENCCGNAVFNPSVDTCQDGHVLVLNASNILMCGDQKYDATTKRCCGKEIVDLISDYECCYSNGKKYNKLTESCCGKDIIPLTESDKVANKLSCCPRY